MVHLLELCQKILLKLFKISTGYCYILLPMIQNPIHRNLETATLENDPENLLTHIKDYNSRHAGTQKLSEFLKNDVHFLQYRSCLIFYLK
jgi:hypothetical protein